MPMRSPGTRPAPDQTRHAWLNVVAARRSVTTRCKVGDGVGGHVDQGLVSVDRRFTLSWDESAGAQWGSAWCRNASGI
jgi:hypothetical protein